jgi:death-on-curing protein
MEEPRFLEPDEVSEIHAETLRRHGGPQGVRNLGSLISAVMSPRNHWHYSGGDLYDLAAVLLIHLARNHPFVDGNKRVSAGSAIVFLAMHKIRLRPNDEMLEDWTLKAAQGLIETEELAAVLRSMPVFD